MENRPSRARSLVGLVSRPAGTASRRPPALPAMTLLIGPVSQDPVPGRAAACAGLRGEAPVRDSGLPGPDRPS
ncbi:hypothetical protein GCM10009527_069520 [Actinomadura nitritigenes]